MGTLTQLVWLSRSALAANQKAIDATASNVANQNTVGYTREVVAFRANDAVSLGGTVGGAVSVEAKTISQRDRVLEQRVQHQTQAATAATARLTALKSAEATFGLTSTSNNASATAIGSALDGFFGSLTALSANPADASTRSGVLAAAGTLASAFRSAATQLEDISATLDSQITTAANQVNGLTAQVATLNAKITALSPNEDAGGLEDQRQQAIQQLSSILGVSQIMTESNGVTLTTTGGAVLVTGNDSVPLTTSTVLGRTQVVGGSPAAILSGGRGISGTITGGTIGGLLQARDADLPGFAASLDELAQAVGLAVNAQNAAGVTSTGAAGGDVFDVSASVSGAALNLRVALSDANGLAAAGPGEGVGGTTNAVALAALASSRIAAGTTAAGYLSDFVGSVGTKVSSAAADDTAQSAALTQAQTVRNALSGVSLDEEAAALTQYQRSYEAAAKVFSIVNTLFAAAMNLGVVTSVS